MNARTVASDECVELVAAEIATRGRIVGIFLHLLKEKSNTDFSEAASKASYLAGRIAGQKAAEAIGKNDLDTLRHILAESLSTKVFDPVLAKSSENEFELEWRTCPIASLADDFGKLGYDQEYLPRICGILEMFDNGFVEGFNPTFRAKTPPELETALLSSGADRCRLVVTTNGDED